MKGRMIAGLLTLGFVSYVFTGCSKSNDSNNAPVTCSGTKSFANDVNPVIQASCASSPGCHAAGSGNGPGALTTYTQIFNARALIRQSVSNGSMPKNSSLTANAKSAIICWIDNGAPNN